MLGIFTCRPGVTYQARDGRPVDTLFVTMGPPADRHTHIILLAAVARMVRETPIIEHLRLCASRDDVVSVVHDLSRQMVDSENSRSSPPEHSRTFRNLPAPLAPSPSESDKDGPGPLGDPEPTPAT